MYCNIYGERNRLNFAYCIDVSIFVFVWFEWNLFFLRREREATLGRVDPMARRYP